MVGTPVVYVLRFSYGGQIMKIPNDFIEALPPAADAQEAERFMSTQEMFEAFYDMNEDEDVEEMKDFKHALREAGYHSEYIEGVVWLIK